MTAVFARRLSVLVAVLSLTLIVPLQSVAQAKAAPTARVAVHRAAPVIGPCAATYWSHAYDDDCRAYLRHAMHGQRLTHEQAACLVGAGVGMFGGGVGALIAAATARGIAGAVVGGAASGCLRAFF